MATSGVVVKTDKGWERLNWRGAMWHGIITEAGKTAQAAEGSAKNPPDTRQLEHMAKNVEQAERQLQPVGGTAAKRTTHAETSQPAPGAASSQQAPEILPRPAGGGFKSTHQAATPPAPLTPAAANAGGGSGTGLSTTLTQLGTYTNKKYPGSLNTDGSVNDDFIKKNFNNFAIVKDIAMYVIQYRDYKIYPVEKFVPGAVTNPNLACVIFPPDKLVRMFVKTNQSTRGAFYDMKMPTTTQGSTLHLFLFWLAYSYGVTNQAWVEGNQVNIDNSPWTNLLDILGIANQTKQELLDKMNDLIGTETSGEWLTDEEKAILIKANYEFNTKIVEMGGKNYKRVYIEY